MPIIATARLDDCSTEHNAATIRLEVTRFVELLSAEGVLTVKVWCSWNPDLPEDSPLQSPEEIISPRLVLTFLDAAVKNEVWTYGDVWNRAGIEALGGSFKFFLGNDKNIALETENRRLLEATRSAWIKAGYEIYESDGNKSVRTNQAGRS